jgi:hypothetical protein
MYRRLVTADRAIAFQHDKERILIGRQFLPNALPGLKSDFEHCDRRIVLRFNLQV